MAHVSSQNFVSTTSDLQMQVINKDTQIRKLQDELVKRKHEVDTVVMTRMSEGTA